MVFNVPGLRDSKSCSLANRCFIGGRGENMNGGEERRSEGAKKRKSEEEKRRKSE
jgi:hypothetical protein